MLMNAVACYVLAVNLMFYVVSAEAVPTRPGPRFLALVIGLPLYAFPVLYLCGVR